MEREYRIYECVVRLARRTAVTRFKHQVGSNPATLTHYEYQYKSKKYNRRTI